MSDDTRGRELPRASLLTAAACAAAAAAFAAGSFGATSEPQAALDLPPVFEESFERVARGLERNSVQELSRTPRGEYLLTGLSADGRDRCFIVMVPPGSWDEGVAMSCGSRASSERDGQEIWHQQPDGGFRLWAKLPAGASSLVLPGVAAALVATGGTVVTTVPLGTAQVVATGPSVRKTIDVPPSG